MKFQLLVAALAGLVVASPIDTDALESRQSVGTTANEYTRSGCRDIIFFFARGSTEVGNLVSFCKYEVVVLSLP